MPSGSSYEDLTGLISVYGNHCFGNNSGITVKISNGSITGFGGLGLGSQPFENISNSVIEIGSFYGFSNNGFAIGSSSSTWRFRGAIGAGTVNSNIFSLDLVPQIIETTVANQTSGPVGTVEGDIQYLITNGATVAFIL